MSLFRFARDYFAGGATRDENLRFYRRHRRSRATGHQCSLPTLPDTFRSYCVNLGSLLLNADRGR